MSLRRLALAAAIATSLAACHATVNIGSTTSDDPGMDAIREAEIRADLFAFAGDSMRGREAGTLDELRAASWMAERARAAGLKPAGDDGTYFQWWPMRRTRFGENSRIVLGGRTLPLWRDVVLMTIGSGPVTSATLDVPIVFIADSAALANTDVRGKAVAMVLSAPATTQPTDRFTIRGNFQATVSALVRQRGAAIARSGAAAAIIVSDDAPILDTALTATAVVSSRGTYGIDSAGAPAGSFARPAGGGAGAAPTLVPTVWVRHGLLAAVRAPDARLALNAFYETFYYPSANVVAVAPGRDGRLAGEYVLFSGHNDHDGVRYPVAGDSIWNGADDNATVNVALLAIARAFTKAPGRRSALFVWHGAEERGLLGSRWYVTHPTVPRERIVAVINGDMIGRNNPDSAALLGVQPPHRNSTALAQIALDANARVTKFALDSIWDRPTHPEGWYFRSDHLPYARAGIPSLMFSTLLHPDYHTPRDEPSRIDVAKLTRMSRWMYATGWAVAERTERPALDPGFRLER